VASAILRKKSERRLNWPPVLHSIAIMSTREEGRPRLTSTYFGLRRERGNWACRSSVERFAQ